MFLEICMQIYSVVFALSRQINKQKYAKTINLLCAGNNVFVKYQTQGSGFNPNPPPCVGPCSRMCLLKFTYSYLREEDLWIYDMNTMVYFY